MAEMTLREVCLTLGVSRRAVQGYENAHLVSATNKTQSGYLLYNDSARERIKQIKLYQNMGFSIKEIKAIIDGPTDTLKTALIDREEKLKADIEHSQMMIVILQKMIANLNT